MTEGTRFRASDGTTLDVRIDRPTATARGALAIWPCAGGAVAAMRPPVEALVAAGMAVVAFNPRGHGRSGGALSLSRSVDDLADLLNSELPGLPVHILGHSAGGGAALLAADHPRLGARVERLTLVAPVLDARASLLSMYTRGTVEEFVQVIEAFAGGSAPLARAVLADDRWLDRQRWDAEELRRRLDGAGGRVAIGELLEELFLPGYRVDGELARFVARPVGVDLLVATEDTWYAPEAVRAIAAPLGVPVTTIASANHHFFTGAWSAVWGRVLAGLAEPPTAVRKRRAGL